MKHNAAIRTLVAGSIAVLVTACGGGGGGSAASDNSLTISGTVATGTVFISNVDTHCQQGSARVRTNPDGSYSVILPDAVTPCMLQATGIGPDGQPLVMHSVVPAGAVGKVRANITPLTELVVAQALGKSPAREFESPDQERQRRLLEETIARMTQQLQQALQAAGMDPNGIDPIKSPLQAAHDGIPGDVYDRLLDQLGARVPPGGLQVLSNQVAVAAASGGTGLVITQALAGGSLAGCPTAVSGPYRTLDLWGKTLVRDIDFRNMRMRASNGVDWLALTATPGEACSFVASGTVDGRAVETAVVLGAQGAGAYRTHYSDTNSPGINGYIFPAQQHAVSEVGGTWSYLHSGNFPGQGNNHYPGQVNVDAAAATMTTCTYDTSTWVCSADPGPAATVTARTDGGFDIPVADAGVVMQMYGYRAPNGTLTLFGSQMGGTYDDPNALLTSIVAAKLDTLPLPAAGSVQKYWDVQFTSNDNVMSSTVPRADAVTVDSVDAGTGTVMRHRSSDGRQDTLKYNQPLTGTRYRLQGTTFASAIQIPLPGLGMVISANALPAMDTGVMFHVLSVERP